MTWLEIMEVLDRMPRHLLNRKAELWHYDDEGNYDVLPVDNVVSPIDDNSEPEQWEPGGDYRLSLQSFGKRPQLNEYMIKIHRVCNVSVMADSPEQAQRIGEALAGGYTRFACDNINEAMCGCDDEFFGVGSPENDHCNLALDAEDSMRVLKEEE